MGSAMLPSADQVPAAPAPPRRPGSGAARRHTTAPGVMGRPRGFARAAYRSGRPFSAWPGRPLVPPPGRPPRSGARDPRARDQPQLDREHVLEHAEGAIAQCDGRRRVRGVILDREVERRDVQRRPARRSPAASRGPARVAASSSASAVPLMNRLPSRTLGLGEQRGVRGQRPEQVVHPPVAESCPTCAMAGRSASTASAIANGWKLPLLIARPSSMAMSTGLSSLARV